MDHVTAMTALARILSRLAAIASFAEHRAHNGHRTLTPEAVLHDVATSIREALAGDLPTVLRPDYDRP